MNLGQITQTLWNCEMEVPLNSKLSFFPFHGLSTSCSNEFSYLRRPCSAHQNQSVSQDLCKCTTARSLKLLICKMGEECLSQHIVRGLNMWAHVCVCVCGLEQSLMYRKH